MKKINLLLSILFTVSILSSCSSDDSSDANSGSNSGTKPKSLTVSEIGRNPYTTNFQYSGNLISRITTSFGTTVTLNYNGDQLSNFVALRDGQSETINLTYENGRLIERRTQDDSEITTFTYNNLGQVSQSVNNIRGTMVTTNYEYDVNGNVNQSQNDFKTTRYIYDNKNNAFRNVFPQVDAEITWPWYGSLVNNQIEVQRRDSGQANFTTQYTYEYDYNSDNYPIQRRQIEPNGSVSETVDYSY